MSPPRLTASALEVRVGPSVLLRGVDIEARAGTCTALLGPSGAGKSTLFRAIVGELPARGRVLVDGVDVSALPMHRRARAGIGYVPQGPSVLHDLSVIDNLRVFARLCGSPADPSPWAARAGLASRLHVAAGSLSGGERRRLELARALLASPGVLLCDEPFAGLGPRAIDDVASLLREAIASGTAIIVADHHVDEALSLSSQACLLVDGSLVLTTDAAAFTSHPLALSRYLSHRP